MGYPVLRVVTAPIVDDDNLDPAELAQLRDAVLAMSERLGRVESRLSLLEDRVGSLEGSVDALENRVGSLENSGGASVAAVSASAANTSNDDASPSVATSTDRKKKRARINTGAK
jgi:predicted nuclease with TOPRIM domain